ncbi:uncharacterized protein [Nothobranchius furzeri]|uniref:LOC107382216-like protein n=1 Tax=Nothobranchius furzeri TaxID=105023 RepID=A0A9D2Y317_NOTFU|nr:putative LOC107382216-like protein [Nothobranchius furzeri]
MPQSSLNLEGRQKGLYDHSCETNHRLKSQIPGRRLVNRAVNRYATRTSESSKVGSLDFPKPPCLVNGYGHHGYRSTKPPHPRNYRRPKYPFSPVGSASAAGRVGDVKVLDGIPTKGATKPGDDHLSGKSEQAAPDPGSSAPKKNPRRKKNFRHKERDDKASSSDKAPPPMPQQEEEDWEKEIQEVEAKNWEKMCFGIIPYDPEDVIHFLLRDLSLRPAMADVPVTNAYIPAIHHTRPIPCVPLHARPEPDQFADVEL